MIVVQNGYIQLDADSPILILCPRGFEIESIVYPILTQYAERIGRMVQHSTWGTTPDNSGYMKVVRYGDMTGRLRRAATRWSGAKVQEAIDFIEKDEFFRLKFAQQRQ